MGGSESFPFLSPFPPFFLTILGKERKRKDLWPFPNCWILSQLQTAPFLGKEPFPKLLKPFTVAAFLFLSFPVAAFPFPVVTFPAFPGNSPLLGPFYRVPLLYITSQWSFIYLCPDWVMGSNPTLSKLISSLSSCFTKTPKILLWTQKVQ